MSELGDGRPVETWLSDMDGVLVHEEHPIPGAREFVERLKSTGTNFMVLTNNSIFTRRDLRQRLLRSGVDGEVGLTTALHEAGYFMSESDPDYVVLGETRTYSFKAITTAIRLLENGARFIATNPDPSGPSKEGSLPATGAVAALITRASGVEPYFVGKPNPLMMRSALNQIEAHSETTVMVGDRMDTDVIAGIESGLRTVLVLTGSTKKGQITRFPYLASRVVDSIADLVDLV